MKTFKDLVFKFDDEWGANLAQMKFDNNYGIEVLFGNSWNAGSNGVDNYGVGIIIFDYENDPNACDWGKSYEYMTPEEVTKIMEEVQNYPFHTPEKHAECIDDDTDFSTLFTYYE